MAKRVVWISLLEVRHIPGGNSEKIHGGEGAFVTGLVEAASAREARTAFANILPQLGLTVVRAEKTRPFTGAPPAKPPAMEMNDLNHLASLARTEQTAVLDSFFAWHDPRSRSSARSASLDKWQTNSVPLKQICLFVFANPWQRESRERTPADHADIRR